LLAYGKKQPTAPPMNVCSEFSWSSRTSVIYPRKGEAHFSRRVKTLLTTLEIQTCMGDIAVENKYSIDSANLPPYRGGPRVRSRQTNMEKPADSRDEACETVPELRGDRCGHSPFGGEETWPISIHTIKRQMTATHAYVRLCGSTEEKEGTSPLFWIGKLAVLRGCCRVRGYDRADLVVWFLLMGRHV
jgi:hypothetical protein